MRKQKIMIGVITGDIIHSQKTDSALWLKILKSELNVLGQSPSVWEIYRGDSFQVEIGNPFEALRVAIKLKASVKSIKGIDVRISIGIGEKAHHAKKVTESNGSAFVYSGVQYDQLVKEKQNLMVSTDSFIFNRDVNFYLKLGLLFMDNWSVNSAQVVKSTMENPSLSQQELGELLGIKQSAVSNRLKRANYSEVEQLLEIYTFKIKELL